MSATRRTVIAGVIASLIPRAVLAQTSPRRIGVLMAGSGRRAQTYVDALVERLGALGWHAGSNLNIELRWGRGQEALYESNAAELTALRPDLIVAQFPPTVAALQRQTSTIPIVFVYVNDPVGLGFVKSLAQPGGNITGFSTYDPPIAGKWLEMLMQITPPVTRIAVLYNPVTASIAGQMLRIIEEAPRPLNVAVRAAPYRDRAEIEAMMQGLAREERSAVLVLGGDISSGIYLETIVAAAALYRLPVVYPSRLYPANGGLMSYGPAVDDLFRRAAGYIDRILKGEKPGDLPVQYPTRFETVLNLKTAKGLGISFAPSLIDRADEIIE